MNKFDLIKDIEFRKVIEDFFNRLKVELEKDSNQLLCFLIHRDFLDKEMPYDYPMYLIVAEKTINRKKIDDICFDIQDEHGWPYGHFFVNSPSRKNFITRDKIKHGLVVEDVYMAPVDIEDILAEKYCVLEKVDSFDMKCLYVELSNLKCEMLKVINRLNVDNVNKVIEEFKVKAEHEGLKAAAKVVKNEFCRKRGEGKTYETNSLVEMKKLLKNYIKGTVLKTNIGIYGRLNASGKSQYMYNLMGFLYERRYPFIFRESFYFHYSNYLSEKPEGEIYKYYSMLDGKEEDSSICTSWILNIAEKFQSATGKRPVIFLDEVDVDIKELKDYFIICGDKDMRGRFNNPEWNIFDIIKEDYITPDYVEKVLRDELKEIGLFNEVEGLDEVIEKISLHSKHPLYSDGRCSIYHGKRLLSLTLVEGARRYLNGDKLYINKADVEKWVNHYNSKFIPYHSVDKDFHCEYIIFDTENLIHDPYCVFKPGEIIRLNAKI